MLKAAANVLSPYITNIFNIIYNTGNFPQEWSQAMISTIHKKGNLKNPDNYRGISLLCSLSKVFTKILNTRLSNWVDDNSLRYEEQAGYRKNYRTIDQIFISKISLVQTYVTKKRVDFICL